MKNKILIPLVPICALIAFTTALCVFLERSRVAEFRSARAYERSEQQRFGMNVLSSEIEKFIKNADSIPVEEFEDLSEECKFNEPINSAMKVAFSFSKLKEEGERFSWRKDDPAEVYAVFYGLKGLGVGKKIRGREVINYAERNEVVRVSAKFADKKFKNYDCAWGKLLKVEKDDTKATEQMFPRYGGWASWYYGSLPRSEKSFSGGFCFEEFAGTLFLYREIRAPKIEFSIQGFIVNKEFLQNFLQEKLGEIFPESSIEFHTENPDFTCFNLPIKFSITPANLVTDAELRLFRLTLALAWLATVILLVFVYVGIRKTQKTVERRRLFSAAIAHDLRSPLAVIESQATALESTSSSDSEKISSLQTNLRQFGSLLDNLLLFSKISNSETMRFKFSDIVFGDAITPILERISERLELSGIDLDINISREAAAQKLRISVFALERILQNLADNSAKHATIPGNTIVTVSASVDPAKGKLFLSMEDNGCGISPEIKKTLFKPFPPSYKSENFGIGLSISRELARLLGGDLELIKTNSTGTQFLLTLKVKK